MTARLTIALTLALSLVSRAGATTYYVRSSGDDARDGLSPETAFASIRPTARLLQNPGDRVIVGPGVYHEGNIKPRGSGTPDAPIVLLADVTGELTHDAPGPVTVVPPNTPDATTGIIVYGRHDVIIDGFDVDGAADAGIQVRPHSRNGSDSGRITVRNTTTRNGRLRGIHVIAAGEVNVVNNTMSRNAGTGVVLVGGASGAIVPLIANNIIEENRFGILLRGAQAGSVADNVLRADGKAVRLSDCDGVSIVRNQMTELGRGITGSGANLTIADNTLDRGGIISLGGVTVVMNNHFMTSTIGLLRFYLDEEASLRLNQNQLPPTYIVGSGRVEIAGNEGELLEAGAAIMTVTDNTFAQSIKLSAATRLELSRNQTTDVEARAPTLLVRDNQVSRWADILAATGTVTGNNAGRLALARYWDWNSDDAVANSRGPYLLDGNVSDSVLRLGDARTPLAGALVQNNTAAGLVRTFARGRLEVRHNDAHGIACLLFEPDAELVLAENVAHQSVSAGLIVIGAARAIVENNTSTDNADSGLAVRGSRNVTIAGNTFRSNPAGGISVLVPLVGDCNGDLRVTVDELTTVVSIVLGRRSLRACAAADANGDDAATIDEIMMAVAAAFDRQDLDPPQVEIRANRVEDNGRFGINVYAGGPVLTVDNRVVRNGGIAIAVNARGGQADTGIVGNILGQSAAEGLLLKGVLAARVRNNVIFSSRESGMLLRDAPQTAVINNLIYANGDDGISVGRGTDLPAHDATLASNTIYANAGWGITIGSAGAPSKGTVVLNNIVDGNLRGGVAAERDSRSGLSVNFNLNNDGNDPTIPPSASDFEGDPRFVAAAGPDGVLGGAGFEDDDLHLQPGTPALDAGSAPAAQLGITGSAVSGQPNDTGVVDVGFHYGASDDPK